jgi:hypothetical protein
MIHDYFLLFLSKSNSTMQCNNMMKTVANTTTNDTGYKEQSKRREKD